MPGTRMRHCSVDVISMIKDCKLMPLRHCGDLDRQEQGEGQQFRRYGLRIITEPSPEPIPLSLQSSLICTRKKQQSKQFST